MFYTRSATINDVSLIRELASLVWAPTYGDILSPEQLEWMFEWMYSEESLKRQLEKGFFLIGYNDETPFGYVSIDQDSPLIVHLQKIYIIPSQQHKGAGKFLIETAFKFAKEKYPAATHLELNVNRQNSAVLFYEKMGLRKLREGDFPIGNGYYMNDYIMGKEL